MAIEPGTRLGPYEIVGHLGAGGMGEVYKARDTRLGRDVAIKVLPPQLSMDETARQRLEREARAVSSLNHPNICTLYDVGHEDDVDFLVMELLEGGTLADRLTRGAIPTEEALRIAREIADALDRAHRKNLIHRDLKPSNIMLTRSGAKLMDFGLAKTSSPTESNTMTLAPTATSPLTTEGAIVGTLQYMAPEQLEGAEATPRSDIFAFGIVLYEMVAGKPAFDGKTQASIVAAILKEDPRPLSSTQPLTPPGLDRLVATCVEKDPEERRQSMHDVLLELKWISQGGSRVASPTPPLELRRSRERWAWILASVALLVAVTMTMSILLRRPPTLPGEVHSTILPPEGTRFDYSHGPMALSPDGRAVVFVARDEEGRRQLWLRPLGAPTAQPLNGTEAAEHPFWSPDSRSVGFFAQDKLKRLDLGAGQRPPDTVCAALDARGATWGPDGTIVFASRTTNGLHRVPASGGEPTLVDAVVEASGWLRVRNPSFLPDGRHFLFGVRSGVEKNSVRVGSLDGRLAEHLLDVDSNAVFAPPGYLLFWREGALRAQPFDPSRLELSGEPVPIAQETRLEPDRGVALFSVSSNGILVYHRGGSATSKSALLIRDREGNEIQTVGELGNFYTPRFSRDGDSVGVDNSGVANNGDIWVYELSRPVGTRLTFDVADESRPVWSPDDDRVAFVRFSPDTLGDVYVKGVSGDEDPEPLVVTPENELPSDWSVDGRFLLFKRESGASRVADIWFYAFEDRESKPFLSTPFDEKGAVFSPDSRWVAYESDESGRLEVYLRPFPEGDQKWQISVGGGLAPRWRGDGKELFYIGSDGFVKAVALDIENGFRPSTPVDLFEVRMRFAGHYDVSQDGQRFVVNTTLDDDGQPMDLVVGWAAGL